MKTMSAFIASAILGLTVFGAPQAVAGGYKKDKYCNCYGKKDYRKYYGTKKTYKTYKYKK
jgi:hypothetical protein